MRSICRRAPVRSWRSWGCNGMGKSTLMKSLIGVMPARSGQIMVDGVDVAGLPSYQRVAHGLAYVPQGRQIFRHHDGQGEYRDRPGGHRQERYPRGNLSNCFRYWPISPSGAAATCQAASSNNWRSRARWPATRRCCCWTSRRRASSRRSSRTWRALLREIRKHPQHLHRGLRAGAELRARYRRSHSGHGRRPHRARQHAGPSRRSGDRALPRRVKHFRRRGCTEVHQRLRERS